MIIEMGLHFSGNVVVIFFWVEVVFCVEFEVMFES